MMEREILKLIDEQGPLTGSEILDAFPEDALILWHICAKSEELMIRTLGTKYLRFDRRVPGFARLSPSILREFLTYSVIGHVKDRGSIEEKRLNSLAYIEKVSKAKADLAYRVVSSLEDHLENEIPINERACFILAGDIVYNMAHSVPRPERSTGKMVNGSDMDLVVVVDDDFPKKSMESLDEAIYQEKYRLLITPHIREEIDYVVKNLERIREQVAFDNFRRMVACKILQEGTLLYGSQKIFQKVKELLHQRGVIDKIASLERAARAFRGQALKLLLTEDPKRIKEDYLHLFYPADESEEFE